MALKAGPFRRDRFVIVSPVSRQSRRVQAENPLILGVQISRATSNSKPLTDELNPWLEKQLARVSRGAPIAYDIRYGLSDWDGLIRFLGRWPHRDRQQYCRAFHPGASHEGGVNWAIIASLIEMAKLNGINPHAWLTDTLTKLVNRWPASRIDELMPWNYEKAGVDTVNV